MNIIIKNGIIIVISLAIGVLIYWLLYDPSEHLKVSAPGMDSIPVSDATSIEKVNIGEYFVKFDSVSSKLKGKWIKFRGEDSDNIVKDGISLIDDFPASGPDILWEVELGEGHAAPVIYEGKVYLLDYLEEEKMDALRCFSLIDGRELWRRSYKVHIKRNHGMSRTIPAITDKYLVSLGPLGHAMCVDTKNGELLWSKDLVSDYNVEIPFWYTGQCPMIDDDIAIFATGGKSILIGVNCASGEIEWESPNPDSLEMSHSSIMPMSIHGKSMYVYAGIGGVAGISAEKDDLGSLLWTTKEFIPSVVAPSPVYLGNNQILLTAGYGAGAAIIEINKEFSVSLLQSYKPKEGLASEQQSPLIIGDYIYAILPKDAGSFRNQMACYRLNDLKNPLWTSGKSARYGLGPYIYADGKFFIVADDGTLSIVKANENSFRVLDSYRAIEGHDAWGPIAIADGMLLMRDSKKMICLNINK